MGLPAVMKEASRGTEATKKLPMESAHLLGTVLGGRPLLAIGFDDITMTV